MRTFVQMIFAIITVVVVGWYVTYKMNPSKICKEHPEREKAAKYIYCWPGFDMPLDTFIDGHSPLDKESRKFKYGR